MSDSWFNNNTFEIDQVPEEDQEKLESLLDWFMERADEISGGEDEIYIDTDFVRTNWSEYEGDGDFDYKNHAIPRDLFFSGRSIHDWEKRQQEIKDAERRRLAKIKAEKDRVAGIEKLAQEEEIRMIHDLSEYNRLKTLFGD